MGGAQSILSGLYWRVNNYVTALVEAATKPVALVEALFPRGVALVDVLLDPGTNVPMVA